MWRGTANLHSTRQQRSLLSLARELRSIKPVVLRTHSTNPSALLNCTTREKGWLKPPENIPQLLVSRKKWRTSRVHKKWQNNSKPKASDVSNIPVRAYRVQNWGDATLRAMQPAHPHTRAGTRVYTRKRKNTDLAAAHLRRRTPIARICSTSKRTTTTPKSEHNARRQRVSNARFTKKRARTLECFKTPL